MRSGKFPIFCAAAAMVGLTGVSVTATVNKSLIAAAPLGSARAALSAAPRPSPASRQAEGRAIETTTFADSLPPDAQRRLLIKIQVLLDRAHFSPGVIDGTPGENLHNALAAYAEAHGLATEGTLTAEIFRMLTHNDRAPVTRDYTITSNDEKGPFIGSVPEDFAKMAKLKHLGYRSSKQELAERFHMSEALLRALNPAVNFRKPGTTILVVRPGNGDLPADVARVDVDRSANQLRLYDNEGTLVAVFPATVGSAERPAPRGRWMVKSVTFNPAYVYDPKAITRSRTRKGVLKIAPGPNDPLGSVWIELTKPTYGIHGAPDPELVGKTASQGYVRLTNWDAVALGHVVKPGTPVILVGPTSKG